MPRRNVTSAVVVDRTLLGADVYRVYGAGVFAGVTTTTEPAAMIRRSQWEVANQNTWPSPHVMRYGGEFEQHWPGVARWAPFPDWMIWSHDIGGHWVSQDGGVRYRHTRGKGFGTIGAHDIAIHSPTGRVVCLAVSNYLTSCIPFEGLYTSDDWGDTWTLRQVAHMGAAHGGVGALYGAADDYVMRSSSEVIVFDDTFAPDRCAAVVGGEAVYTSPNKGDTWVNAISLTGNIGVHDPYRLLLSKKVNGRAWLACAGRGTGTAAEQHAGLWRIDNLWTTPTMTNLSAGLPDPAANPFTNDTGNGAGHIRWIDFENPATQDGQLIVSSAENGMFRIPMSATHTETGPAVQWIADTTLTKLTVCPANANIMVRFEKNNRLLVTENAGTTWVQAQVVGQPAPWRETTWKTTVAGQWDTHSWHPTKTAGEIVFCSHAQNWMVRNNFSSGAQVICSNDYVGGWNSAGGWSRTDWTNVPATHVQGFYDHGVGGSLDNGITTLQMDTPKNLEVSGSASGNSNSVAKHPTSNVLIAGLGDNGNQQLYRGHNLTLGVDCVWTKIGDTDGDGIMEAGEGNNFLKDRSATFYLPGTDFFYSGNQRGTGANPAGLSSIGGGDIAVYGEIIGYTKVAKSAGNWVVWAATIYAGGAGNHIRQRAIWRGVVDPAGSGAIVWDSTTTPFLASGYNLFPDGQPFYPDPNNIGVIYIRHSGGGVARWNGSTLTDLGLMAHTALNGDASFNGVHAIAIDQNDTNHGAVLCRQPGFPMIFWTNNLTSGTPTWVAEDQFSHLGTGSIDVNPHTSERVYDGPFGRFVFPAPTGVNRGNPLMRNNGIRYSQINWAS